MHPMTHVWFPTHFASLEYVFVVQIWILDYIKCIENLISNIYNGQTKPKHAPQWNMYIFSSHFGALEHVFVVPIWIMNIKCVENLIISNNI